MTLQEVIRTASRVVRQPENPDPSGMWQRLAALPQQMQDAWRLGASWDAGIEALRGDCEVRRVVVVGMGGSAIGGQLVARIVEARSAVPVELVRDCALPVLDRHTLLVASSFSGETEEVLAALREAAASPCLKMAITRGGTLGREATASGIPTLFYAYEGEPRSALAYGTLALLGVLSRLGLCVVTQDEMDAAVREVGALCQVLSARESMRENRAQALAREIRGAVPFILADASLEPAAVRWQTQFNENAKCWAFAGTLPEALHNVVEGIGRYPSAPGSAPFHVVLLEDAGRPAAARARLAAVQEHLFDCGVPCSRLTFTGGNLLSTLLQACTFGDWVSYYLAVEAGIDPSPVPTITSLKRRVAQLSNGSSTD
ncbi:MAG: hypothetical protein M0R73_01470 [Dehalococcoidia bacterium]|nr:hypothetical protein [Dehalococcoidia bacterium]